MEFSLKGKFTKKAAIILASSAVALSGCSSKHDKVENDPGVADEALPRACINAGQTRRHLTDTQLALDEILRTLGESESGAHQVALLEQQETSVCFIPELNERSSCGVRRIGNFSHTRNRVGINPAFKQVVNVNTVAHEARHLEQGLKGIYWRKDGNIREEERVILKWATEADARVMNIVYAYEMAQLGDPVPLQNLKNLVKYQHMVRAFEQSMADRPGDTLEAIRAAFKVFRQNTQLARGYDNRAMDWIEGKRSRAFNPNRRADELLTDEILYKLGETRIYGNYMDEALMEFIRDSYGAEDHERLLHDRKMAAEQPTLKCG